MTSVHDARINHTFLDAVLAGRTVDHYYHLGTTSDDPLLRRLRDVRAVVLSGSGERIVRLADEWSQSHAGARVLALPKDDRFVTRYCAGVIFASHGMGMPSAAIALQELMRLVFFLKGGELALLDDVFWARVGTSGGVGVPPGSLVITTEALMSDLRPYRVMRGNAGAYWFDGRFPAEVAAEVVAANQPAGPGLILGKTVATNEFFLEQFRRDGAICLETAASKQQWLAWIHDAGVRNIEMEGAMFAGYLNHWGFPSYAMICCTLLDRLVGDQVTASPAELLSYSERTGSTLLNYLRARLG